MFLVFQKPARSLVVCIALDMKVIIPIKLYGDYITSKWFLNSTHDLFGNRNEVWTESDGVHKLYEEAYGVKIGFDMFGWIEYVEFPNREAAVEFLLRWS
jgi:hypothetical protein